MTFQTDKEGQNGRKPHLDPKTSHAPERRGRKRAPASPVGDALRSVYDRTVAEDIPPEMLDLLGKLG